MILWKLLFLISLCLTFWTTESKEYIVNDSKCKIPHLNPFNKDVKDFMVPSEYVSCNHSELLSYIIKTGSNSAVLHLNEDLLPQYSTNATCCYSYITRNGSFWYPDVGISITPCVTFSSPVVLKNSTVMVTCYEWQNGTIRIVYENVHQPVLAQHLPKQSNNQTKPISVLFVVIDGISRLNFIRTLPQTHRYLLDSDFIEMKGYTKVADNTFPNAMAFLTGFNLTTAKNVCKPTEFDGLDNCPMIWYDFKKLGYVTAYAEDHTTIGTFNYHKKGFTNPPTTYYFKPYLEAAEMLQTQWSYMMPYCSGPESSGERVLNLAKDFATTFINSSTFGVFWMNTFSHNDINAPHGMDTKLKQFFVDLKTSGVLDESLVIVLSDHGVRYGDIRTTKSGWFEERMPVNMISTPKKFQQQFPQLQANLKRNADKLTSTYDLYMTLQHILSLYTPHQPTPSSACPKCSSLFQTMPSKRSCAEAGIPFPWCPCQGYFLEIDNRNALVLNTTDLALRHIKGKIAKYGGLCEKYVLTNVRSAGVSESNELVFVVFETDPFAVFLTTAEHPEVGSRMYTTRIDNESFCVRNMRK